MWEKGLPIQSIDVELMLTQQQMQQLLYILPQWRSGQLNIVSERPKQQHCHLEIKCKLWWTYDHLGCQPNTPELNGIHGGRPIVKRKVGGGGEWCSDWFCSLHVGANK